ncbi:protein of unknown function [Streptantibioticus cattleyicolor NRRL 8057 = DSM 46488]|nr:protein of unknown function [Streptantibioticus cattleyicolor NRRL 8057 = DSM 46488]
MGVFERLVGVAGFEPTTFRSQSGRATKLRHTPSVRHVAYMAPHTTTAIFPRGVPRRPGRGRGPGAEVDPLRFGVPE